MSIQSIEEDLWISLGTSTFGKREWLIAVTGITQTIAVIVNIIASWTIIILQAVNNESTFYHGDNDVYDNDDSSNSNIVDNDSNCLHHTSDCNESFSFPKGTSTHGDSKVFFNGLNGHKFYYNSSQD